MSNISSKRSDAPLKIGITGGIGSGKSLVCKIFGVLGIPFFEADKAARELYDNDPWLKNQLIALFGDHIYLPAGKLDRQKLAAIIFRDKEALRRVNGIVHPLVREAFEKWTICQSAVYVLYEAAVLSESGYHRNLHASILVSAPTEIRIRRVIERDHISREQVLERMHNQQDDPGKKEWVDYVIINDGNEFLIPQVLETDKKIREHGKFR